MKRRLITGERIMYVDAATPVNCVFTVKIRGTLTRERLRPALSKIQAKHPLLKIGIEEDRAGMPWFVTRESIPEIPLEVVERQGDDDWVSISRKEWKKRFDIYQGPLARVVWVKSPEVSELMLVCAHCICDGTTIINLMQELLMLADQPDKEIGQYQSFRTIEELVPSAILSKKKALKARMVSGLLRVWLSLRLLGKSAASRGGSYLVRCKLGKEESAAVFERLKAEQVSFHAVSSAAILQAIRQVRDRQAHQELICPVDIRRYIGQVKSDTMFAFAPVIKLSVAKDPDTGFWANARKLKEDLSEKVPELNAPAMLIFGEYLHGAVDKMVQYLRSCKGAHDLTFSNLGRVHMQENYQSFELEDVYSPTVAFPWRNPSVIVTSTFRGQIDLALISSDSFLPRQEAEAIKEKIIELLLNETGTKVKAEMVNSEW